MAVRKRRTAEESKSLVLQVAARRLREAGLEGLNITGVAEEAGISHATLLHHFGSSSGMRDALADKMTEDLVEDLVAAFDARVPTVELTRNVFAALAEGGHAKLLAWRAVEGDGDGEADLSAVTELFARLMKTTQDALGLEDPKEVQKLIYLVAIAGIGYGLAGNVLAAALGMSDGDIDAFPEWMMEHITT